MSTEALLRYDTNDTEKLTVSHGSLTVPASWSIFENAKIKGISGFTHIIDSLAESPMGKKVGILLVTEYEASVYEAIGKIHIMKNDLKVPIQLVMCVPIEMARIANSLVDSPEVLIVNEVWYGKTRINKNSSTAANSNSKVPSDYVKKERVKRDRMKIMLDVLNLL